jgi:hypothetical protein
LELLFDILWFLNAECKYECGSGLHGLGKLKLDPYEVVQGIEFMDNGVDVIAVGRHYPEMVFPGRVYHAHRSLKIHPVYYSLE